MSDSTWVWLLCCGPVAVAIVAYFWSVIRAVVEGRRDKEFKVGEQQRWDLAMRNLALTCRNCSGLAPPIPETNNRYRCEKCG